MFDKFVSAYHVVQLATMPLAVVGFGFFYGKRHKWSKEFGIKIAIGAVLAALALGPMVFVLLPGFLAYACFYVADLKHRSRFIWTFLSLAFGGPFFLILLCLPAQEPETATLSLK